MTNYPMLDDKLATLRNAIEGGVKADSMQAMKLMELVDAIGEQFKCEIADASAPPVDALDPVEAFLADVRAELIRARTKFPGDRIMTIALAEEFGELCKAVLDESAANVRKEAVQTAVMCARVVLDGDGSVNDWRRERGLDPLVEAEND
ncbi:hypothetical protein SAMN05446935_6114 [Burkholderia sp. YR290]|nr:hypothetical protein SAMN05446935_6114 [Burkholderia sp. YR290]